MQIDYLVPKVINYILSIAKKTIIMFTIGFIYDDKNHSTIPLNLIIIWLSSKFAFE
jgi:hypothetical protein